MKRIAVALVICTGVLILFVSFLAISKKSATTQTPIFQSPTPTPILPPAVQFRTINYHQIFSDDSVAQQMGDKLRVPLSTERQGDYIVGHFASDSASIATDVYQQDQVAKIVAQTMDVDNSYYSGFAASHIASEQETLYDPSFSGSGFVWKIFPADGVAFLTNPDVGFTGKILYFAPTSYKIFVDTTAKVFSMTNTQPPEQDMGKIEQREDHP